MHQGFKNIRLIISFALISALLWAVPAGAEVVLDRVVAVVNNEVITWLELYRGMEAELGPEANRADEELKRSVLKENEAVFLNQMIDLRLQVQEARRLGISADDADIDAAIENIKKKYSLDSEALEKAIREEGYTMPEYRETLAEQILVGRALEREVKSKLDTVAPDEEDLSVDAPVRYRVGRIFFSDEAGSGEMNDKAAEALRRLDEGEDFSAVAGELSEGPAARRGGDLGYISEGEMSADFARVINDLRPGQTSQPLPVAGGVHILKLLEKVSPEDSRRELLFQKRYAEWIKSLREKSLIEIKL